MISVPCKICLTATESFAIESIKKTYHHCPRCEFIFLDPAAGVSDEQERERYHLHRNSTENEGYVKMFLSFIKLLKPHLNSQIDTALDFGCGPVPVLAHLLREEGIAKKIAVFDKFFYPESSLLTGRYGLITCTEVLEHLAEPLEYFTLFKNLLTPNGLFAFMTGFHNNSRNDFRQWWYKNDITHRSFFSKQTLHRIATHFSFKLFFLNEKNCALFLNR